MDENNIPDRATIEAYLEELKKNNPCFDLEAELGKYLFIPADLLTEKQKQEMIDLEIKIAKCKELN